MSLFHWKKKELHEISWKDVWKGKAHLYCKEGQTLRNPTQMSQRIAGTKHTLSEWYRQNKVPVPVRRLFSVFTEKDEIIGDICTGIDCQNKTFQKANHLLTIKEKGRNI